MNVLITGGAGFIGSNLVHYISQFRPNWNMTVVDLLTYAGNLQNISSVLEGPKCKFVRADIADSAAMSKVFSSTRFDLVFHLAAESHVDRSIMGASAFVRTNVLGTQTLLDLARSSDVQRFVHVSTDEVYGSLGREGRFVETTPLDPTSPYAASKAASDLMVLACYKTHRFPVLVTRCTNNYGPYQFPEKFLPLFISNALEDKKLPLYGDGTNVRSWIHVNDHCEGLLRVAEKGREGEVYNLGGEEAAELENRYVAELLLQALKKPKELIEFVKDRPAHDLRYAVDCSKAQRELGWMPAISFEEGLQETVKWYSENRVWWEAIKSGEYLSYYQENYGERLSS
ncbi:MAG: dTDP-glucose 4,6-dehydratase [Bdellovibrionales bacterium]|nr:dTDP-glucose 4,6-dehydratase [Bdellovibrionales bacterium]